MRSNRKRIILTAVGALLLSALAAPADAGLTFEDPPFIRPKRHEPPRFIAHVPVLPATFGEAAPLRDSSDSIIEVPGSFLDELRGTGFDPVPPSGLNDAPVGDVSFGELLGAQAPANPAPGLGPASSIPGPSSLLVLMLGAAAGRRRRRRA